MQVCYTELFLDKKKPQKQEVSEAIQERRRPDLNRWILVLQTIALPLGYCAVFSYFAQLLGL